MRGIVPSPAWRVWVGSLAAVRFDGRLVVLVEEQAWAPFGEDFCGWGFCIVV